MSSFIDWASRPRRRRHLQSAVRVYLIELLKVVNPALRLACPAFYHRVSHHRGRQYLQLYDAFVHTHRRNTSELLRAHQRTKALARGPIRMFRLSPQPEPDVLCVFCALIGFLIFRSKFLPAILGLLMMARA